MRISLGFGGLALVGLLGACGFDTGGVVSGSASVGDESVGNGDTATEDSASASASASGSASVSASGASTEDGSVSDPTVTDASATDPTTSASDASATSDGTTTTAGATDESGTSVPVVHHLAPTDQTACNEPLWCHYTGDVWSEFGEPTYGQQCFTSPTAPPFELLSLHYVVADVAPELTAFLLEVYSHDAGGPNEVIHFVPMAADAATAGHHEHVFETPVQIVDSQFCVGFATPYEGLAGALGMAVDAGTSVDDVSYIRLEGPTGCTVATWTDVIVLDPNPSGNWCMDVQIRELD